LQSVNTEASKSLQKHQVFSIRALLVYLFSKENSHHSLTSNQGKQKPAEFLFIGRSPAENHFIDYLQQSFRRMVLAQKTVVRERRKNGELPAAQQISHLLLENTLLVHHIRRSQLN
jgi:hypothetical protein